MSVPWHDKDPQDNDYFGPPSVSVSQLVWLLQVLKNNKNYNYSLFLQWDGIQQLQEPSSMRSSRTVCANVLVALRCQGLECPKENQEQGKEKKEAQDVLWQQQ